MLDYLLVFPFALAVSAFAMLTGGEGAILFIPLFLAIGVDPASAFGTAFVTQLFGKASGTIGYLRAGGIQWGALLRLAGVGVPFVAVGSLAAAVLPAPIVRFSFGLAAIALSLIMLLSLARKQHGTKQLVRGGELTPWLWVPALAGFITGAVAIGTGTINTVLLERGLGLEMRKAVATAVVAMACSALAGALVHTASGSVSWELAAFTVPAVLIGGQLGPRLAPLVSVGRIKLLFVAITLLVGAYMCAAELLV